MFDSNARSSGEVNIDNTFVLETNIPELEMREIVFGLFFLEEITDIIEDSGFSCKLIKNGWSSFDCKYDRSIDLYF